MEKQQYSIKRQLTKLTISFLGVNLLLTFLAFLLFSLSDLNTFANVIVSTTLFFVFFVWLFGTSYEFATSDLKEYSPLKAYAGKGMLLSIPLVTLITLSWLFYIISWALSSGDVFYPTTFISNLIYIFMTSSVFNLVNVAGSSANFMGQISALLSPFLICTLGYYAGYKKWDTGKYLRVIMFEKKK